jgi:hypothetical protein
MPWVPYDSVPTSKGQKHCEKCHGTGMIRVRFGGSISDDDFHTCSDRDREERRY